MRSGELLGPMSNEWAAGTIADALSEHFGLRPYGIGIARRAWVTPANVVNTWKVEQVLRWAAGHAA